MGRVSELNQSIFLIGILYLLLNVGSDQILQSILNKDLLFFRICGKLRCKFKETGGFMKVYLKDDWDTVLLATLECEIQGSFKLLTRTCITSQIYLTSNLVNIDFPGFHFEATEKQI